MSDLFNAFVSADYSSQPLNIRALLLGLCLAFLCGQAIAWIYMITHSGLSYSRGFVNSLVVIPMIVSMVMMVLNNNLVTAFGLMAVFAVVRFRNVLRDTFDTSYVLAVLVIGMGCGTQRFSLAVISTLMLIVVMFYLSYSGFGSRFRYDLILNLRWTKPASELPLMTRVLNRHGRKIYCTSHRADEATESVDLCYRVLLRDPQRVEELLRELRAVNGVARVSGVNAEQESEL